MTGIQDDMPTGVSNSKPLWKRFFPVAVVAAGLGLGYGLGLHEYLSLNYLAQSQEMLAAFVAANPLLAPLGFVVIYALAVAFSFPAASILTIFAGFLFGWLLGGALVAVAATLGATAIFLAARSAFGDALRKSVGPRVRSLADGFEENALSYLLVLRLAPVFPFFVMNIAPALFNVKLRDYIIATFVGILPGTFAYAYLGLGVQSVLDAARASGREPSISDLITPEITFAFVALAAVAALPTIIRKLRGKPAA
jgi:uncharacterized membrane protein YdjX (TVP38/TMEM64 family)